MRKDKIRFPKEIPKEFFRKDRLLILLLSGILLLVLTIPVAPEEKDIADLEENSYEISYDNKTVEGYAKYLEAHLEDILTLIENAGEIRVMVTLEDAGEKVVEKDTESVSESVEEADSEGGTRKSNNNSVKEVSIYEGIEESGNPYITKEKSPVVSGVVVIAQGGNNAVVVRNITEAVQALFDIDTHKIKVIKGN